MTNDLRRKTIAALFAEADKLNFGTGGRPPAEFAPLPPGSRQTDPCLPDLASWAGALAGPGRGECPVDPSSLSVHDTHQWCKYRTDMSQNQIDALRIAPLPAFQHIVDGQRISASDGGTMAVVSPIDGSALTTCARGTTADTDAAIAAARRAFDDGRWSDLPPPPARRHC